MQPDVLTLHSQLPFGNEPPDKGGVAVAEAPPRVAITQRLTDAEAFRLKRKTIAIHQRSNDEPVALIEIVSPASKDRERSVQEFVHKVCRSLNGGLHVLLVNLAPPSRFDPSGMHGAIWE